MGDMSCNSVPISLSVSRFTDDRASTDSGISSRGGSSSSSSSSAGSGSSDERSGSRSSAFSGLDESSSVNISSHHQVLSLSRKSPSVIGIGGGSAGVVGGANLLAADRFYAHQPHSSVVSSDGARVWRDPSALLIAETNIRHVDSLQHQSLLMSHHPVATGSPSSSSAAAVVSPSSIAAPTTPSALYPQPPSVTSMITPHLHHQLPPHSIYPQIPEMLWKQQRYAVSGLPMTPAHLHPVTDDLFERERASYHHERERHDRLLREREREREQEREADKQQKEREKHQQERERQEKDKLEKQRAEIAVHEHFAESLKRSGYNLGLSALPPVPVARVNEEDRKRHEQQQRLARSELREREKISSLNTFSPYQHSMQIPKSVSSSQNNKNEYITTSSNAAVIQNRVNPVKSQMTLPKSEPVYNNMHGYPAYQKPLNFNQDKPKIEQLKNSVSDVVINSLANTKSSSHGDRDHDPIWWNGGMNLLRSSAPPPLDMKNSVIVKNDVKSMSQSPHLLSTTDRVPGGIPTHSPSPKMRVNDPHYLQPPPSSKPYEYRSPSQSPLQTSHAANSTSPHQLSIDGKLHHRHQQPQPSSHHRQSPLPPTHRQSPHHRQSPLPVSQPSSQLPMSHHRHSPHSSMQQANTSPSDQRYGALYPKTLVASAPNAGSYPYSTSISVSPSVTAVSTPAKPKVSSPAPPHMYPKPLSAASSSRVQEMNVNPMSLKTLIPPSPYQQLSQHQPPPSSTAAMPSANLAPPPAHSSHPSSVLHEIRLGFPSSSNHASLRQPELNTSSASVTMSQTQPLDLGVREPVPKVVQTLPVPLTTSSAGVAALVTSETSKRKLEEEAVEEVVSPKKVCPAVTVVAATEEPAKECTSEPSPSSANTASATTDVTTVASSLSEENAVATPLMLCSSPSTPAKVNPFAADCEKSNSPKPPSYGGHKLKKAWLQRHSGEDIFDDKSRSSTNGSLSINENDGNVPTGGASCADRVANNSPLSANTVTKDVSESSNNSALTSLNNSLSNIGSMAVNSISKNKTSKGSAKKNAKESRSSPVILNGHVNAKIAAANSDESSSSDAEAKSSPKRVPPKLKRKKLAAGRKTQNEAVDESLKRKKLNSTSSTDSDKESASEKESDNSTAGKKTTSGGREDKKDSSKKRGRKPKVSGNYSLSGNGGGKDPSESPKEKKFRDGSQEQRDLFPKPPISQLKKTGESFLQDGPCFEVAPKLAKCRECRWTPNQRSRNAANIFCRFYAFRRLRYTKNGQLAIAGFSDPHKDPKQEDLNLWLPNTKNPPTDLDLEIARFTLVQVGDQFCDLLTQEAEALNIHISEDKKIAWKRVVQGIREMCDVCETTLFNFHWACSKCGFVVCIDCYKSRKNGTVKVWGDGGKDRDDMSWLLCTNRQPHEQEKLMITQVIAGDSLMTLAKLSHESRAMWDIPMHCGCLLSTSTNASSSNGICKEILRNLKQEKLKKAEQLNGQLKSESNDEKGNTTGTKTKKGENDALTWLADVALGSHPKSADECESSSDSDESSNFSTLRELLIRPSSKANGNSSQPGSPSPAQPTTTTATAAANKPKHKKSKLESFDEVLKDVGDDNDELLMTDGFINGSGNSIELKYFVRRHMIENRTNRHRNHMPSIRIMTLSESKLLYPDVPHSWLCDGRLLRLTDPTHPGNYTIFQDQWRRGQPVIVSDVSKRLDPDLWHPDSFIKDFGDVKNDLINCMTGNIVPNQPMRKFWEGFEFMNRRLKDEKGNSMLLKLKDWPPGEDFAEMLPSRYNDLMNVLPLGEYTQRNGKLNLASRLPECFVRPDLGPKMYNAYGSAMYPGKGTTNLHLDISDAVNVMVYVGIPQDGDNEEHIKEAYRAIDEAGCDILTRRRVREKGELPGALWHIYAARDADKIRDLLNKVAIERGTRLEQNHDPIHDQSWYLDGTLRERLRKEYAVEGYAIVQCMGDAVFVPAGAPHQVRNLHNCIKVAEDFVSPENVSYCFHLTQEFRDLSDTHSNHEDKLQIKNIMYHAVKDSLSVLGAALLKNSSNNGHTNSTNGSSNANGNTNSSSSNVVTDDKDSEEVEDGKSSLPELKEFAIYIVRKFTDVARRNGKVYMELLFWKTNKEAYEIEEGYGTLTTKPATKNRKKIKNGANSDGESGNAEDDPDELSEYRERELENGDDEEEFGIRRLNTENETNEREVTNWERSNDEERIEEVPRRIVSTEGESDPDDSDSLGRMKESANENDPIVFQNAERESENEGMDKSEEKRPGRGRRRIIHSDDDQSDVDDLESRQRETNIPTRDDKDEESVGGVMESANESDPNDVEGRGRESEHREENKSAEKKRGRRRIIESENESESEEPEREKRENDHEEKPEMRSRTRIIASDNEDESEPDGREVAGRFGDNEEETSVPENINERSSERRAASEKNEDDVVESRRNEDKEEGED